MACGVPCIASDVRGNRDLLSSDSLCKSNEEDEWKRLLEKFFSEYTNASTLDNVCELSKIIKLFKNIYFD